MRQPRRRLLGVTVICALTIALLVAFSGPQTASESPSALFAPTAADGPQRLSQPDVDLWAGLPAALAADEERRALLYLAEKAEQERQARAEAERERQAAAEAQQAAATTSAPAPSPSGGSGDWYRLADCESGGDWGYNPHTATWGSRYYEGGLQFAPGTWDSFKLPGYPDAAYLASPSQQIAVGERVRAAQGWSAWPRCSAKLGLR
jgi:hypothetical protein